ncbi:MAG: YciI family protein [Clostridium sp.]|uniref:YciI family protein n=1 Tax=Clostridium sp. TaxID=1506 RepID=UPI003EE559AC
MNFFMVEGTILNKENMTDEIMNAHIAYTQKAMDSGLVLLSGLKEDMTGGIFIMKASSKEEILNYLNNEPFKLNNIQDYKVTDFMTHYLNKDLDLWLK